jgi:hypothetical protein
VLLEGIELSTSPLPRVSTIEILSIQCPSACG